MILRKQFRVGILRLRDYHPLGSTFPGRSTHVPIFDSAALNRTAPATPRPQARFRLFPFRSPLLRESRLISTPPGTEMFQFPGLSSVHYVFMNGYPPFRMDGFPHSEIRGSKVVCTSPQLIAAYHVLHQRRLPRHPPYALIRLATSFNPPRPIAQARVLIIVV